MKILPQLAEVQCTNGHKHYKFLSRVAFTMFNISATNYVSSLNDGIRKSKVSNIYIYIYRDVALNAYFHCYFFVCMLSLTLMCQIRL